MEGYSYTIQNTLLLFGMCILMAFYIWLSNKELVKYDEKIKNEYSSIDLLRLDWVYNYNFILIILAVVIGPVLIVLEKQSWNVVVIGSFTSLMYVYILYKSISPKNIEATDIELKSVNKEGKKATTKLSEERIIEISNKLMGYLNEHKPWQNPQLTITKMATELSVPSYQLSYVINTLYKKIFFDLINEYRTDHSKNLLNKPEFQNLTFDEIAEICGFGSKSTFNRAFKKSTGMTPKYYRTTVIEQSASDKKERSYIH